jgi:hypothetical protein
MPPSYKQNKMHIYKWREKNNERLKEINRMSKRKYNLWNREKLKFLQILLL